MILKKGGGSLSRIDITVGVLVGDEKLAGYLRRSEIKPATRGGTFVGNREVAPDEFRKYGIVLPKGGMIIPDIEPDKLKEIIVEPDRLREEQDVNDRRNAEKAYLGQVKEILSKSGVSDIQITAKDGKDWHRIGDSSWHKSFFVRGEEEIFSLHSEEEPLRGLGDDKSFKPWQTCFSSLEKVELFLKEEARLIEARKFFVDRINRLIELSCGLGQQGVGEDGWDRTRVELFLYDDYSQPRDWSFFGRRTKSVFSAHRIMYRKILYKLTEEDIKSLEGQLGERATRAAARQDMLKKLFFERLGEFTFESRDVPSEVRHSLMDGRVIDDSSTERHYFLGKEEVTREEYEWLNTFLGGIAIPKGSVRVKSDTNKILPLLEIPGRKDVLVVVGKTGSRRGVWSYGEWFRGHPSQCQINFLNKGTARQIKSVTLNGKVQDSGWVDLGLWTDPISLAARAIREVGIENPIKGYAEALVEAWKRLELQQADNHNPCVKDKEDGPAPFLAPPTK